MNNFNFCIVIPMYNEEANVERCVNTLSVFLDGIITKSSIIAVNDGSMDDTGKILHSLLNKYKRLIIETHKTNKGYGAANITGGKRAFKEGFKYALFMDADLTQNVNYIYNFIDVMKKDIDFIKATRYAKNGGVEGVPFKRWVVSWVGNVLARAILRLPLTDYTNGFRAVKTDIMSKVSCRERGFAYLIEEVREVSKYAKTYAEVPYILTVRENNNSRSKFQYSPKIYLNYLKHLFGKEKRGGHQ